MTNGKQFEQDIRPETAGIILDVLEKGGLLGNYSGIPADLTERFREIRRRVLLCDVYESLYGELPEQTIDPDWHGDVFGTPFDPTIIQRAAGAAGETR